MSRAASGGIRKSSAAHFRPATAFTRSSGSARSARRAVAGRRIAGGKDHPVRVETQRRNLGGCKIAVVIVARSLRWSQDKPRLCLEANEKHEFERIVSFVAPLKLRPYVFDSHGKLHRFDRFAPAPNVIFLD